uniref:Beta-2-microglobulin n=1 Tax=Sinocyclocheilus grahami TaxID=75366 RepID=A0A672PPW2_SINGR
MQTPNRRLRDVRVLSELVSKKVVCKIYVFVRTKCIRPSVNVYTEFPEQQGKVNVLYCYATGFYPGDIEVNFYLNGQKSTVKAKTSDLMYGEDWTFRVYKYMNITPQYEDKYTCEVRHSKKCYGVSNRNMTFCNETRHAFHVEDTRTNGC